MMNLFLKLLMILLFLVSCSNQKELTPQNISGRWILEKINEKKVSIDEVKIPPFITITEDFKLSGYNGCNNFFGLYTISSDPASLEIKNLNSTRKLCTNNQSIDNLERSFMSTLIQSPQVEVYENKLIIEGLPNHLTFIKAVN
ncbi:hypothetical protein CF386_11890 [Paraphotobacterium marinum]|uniref:DUF306 domain-containing protein n=1 Tax=Paraphotobacterium marinum TaxID=1755811 RepID=A0A220VH99_9GAMM|nr:META domain-containing protein [Paraphotobacterium marinum]ASK79737.1 hypothetical protein CF386_11890 [Paraphotobacterium marinum]